MRRVGAFLKWDKDRWLSRTAVKGMKDMTAGAVEGRAAYAHRQAALRDDLLRSCQELWKPTERWMSTRVVDDGDSGAPRGSTSVDTSRGGR